MEVAEVIIVIMLLNANSATVYMSHQARKSNLNHVRGVPFYLNADSTENIIVTYTIESNVIIPKNPNLLRSFSRDNPNAKEAVYNVIAVLFKNYPEEGVDWPKFKIFYNISPETIK